MDLESSRFYKAGYWLYSYTYQMLLKWGVAPEWAGFWNMFTIIFTTLVACKVLHYVVKKTFRFALARGYMRYHIELFHHLLHHRFAHNLAYLPPLILIKNVIPIAFINSPAIISALETCADIAAVFIAIRVVMAVLRSLGAEMRTRPAFKDKPLESYLQVANICFLVLGTFFIFSRLTGQRPGAFLTSIGAASAIIILVFKDVILGFVASIQVSSNDMVRIGDWITMPKYGADGDVIEINLTTVKVQNFDKTVTTIPTYSLISDSFQNWRAMHQAGGRRIKRAIFIKQGSIRYLTADEVETFKQIQSIRPYIEHRQRDIERFNAKMGADKSLLINGRNLTNSGLFRKYIDTYISNHTGVNKRFVTMVRQLAPTPNGMPLEIYMFTNTTVWVEYESIMADIFDHVIAAAGYFDLEIYEAANTVPEKVV